MTRVNPRPASRARRGAPWCDVPVAAAAPRDFGDRPHAAGFCNPPSFSKTSSTRPIGCRSRAEAPVATGSPDHAGSPASAGSRGRRACSTRSRPCGDLTSNVPCPSFALASEEAFARSGWVGSTRALVKEHGPTPTRNAFHRTGTPKGLPRFRNGATALPRFCHPRFSPTRPKPRLLPHGVLPTSAARFGPRDWPASFRPPMPCSDTGRREANPAPTVRLVRGARLSAPPPAEHARAPVVTVGDPRGWENPTAPERPRPRLGALHEK